MLRDRLRAWAFPFWIWLGSRIALAGASSIGLRIHPHLETPFRPRPLYEGVSALDGWCRWDCEHFLGVAVEGYVNGGQTNFFPLLPSLTHGLYLVTRIPHHWGILIVANVAALLSFIVLYRMFHRLSGDEQVARCGVALFAAYPFAFFQAGGYPESLMILTTALAIDFATRGHHLRAGAVLAYGAFSRHLALLAGFGLFVAQLQQRPSVRKFLLSPALLGLALPPLAFAGYLLYQKLQWGSFLAFYEARANWGFLATWGLVQHLGVLTRKEPPLEYNFLIITSFLPFALITAGGLAAILRRKEARALAAFGVVLMGLSFAIGLWGVGRYSASCWPAFYGLGLIAAKRPTLFAVLLAGFALFQGLFFYMFSHAEGIL